MGAWKNNYYQFSNCYDDDRFRAAHYRHKDKTTGEMLYETLIWMKQPDVSGNPTETKIGRIRWTHDDPSTFPVVAVNKKLCDETQLRSIISSLNLIGCITGDDWYRRYQRNNAPTVPSAPSVPTVNNASTAPTAHSVNNAYNANNVSTAPTGNNAYTVPTVNNVPTANTGYSGRNGYNAGSVHNANTGYTANNAYTGRSANTVNTGVLRAPWTYYDETAPGSGLERSGLPEVAVRAGVAGEQATAATLTNGVLGNPAFHGFLLNSVKPMNKLDIDHVLICNRGLFLIDSKNYAREITVANGMVSFPGVNRPPEDWANSMRDRMQATRGRLLEYGYGATASAIPVYGAYSMVNKQAVMLTPPTSDVMFIPTSHLADYVGSKPVMLDNRLVDELYHDMRRSSFWTR